MSKQGQMQRISLPNGNDYYGHVNRSGLPHGMASRFDNRVEGWVYNGQMRDGMRHGDGTCHFNGNTWYRGNWENDTPNGTGKGVMVNGTYFDGNVVRGRPMGQVHLQVECVVSGCPQAQLPLAPSRRIIPRSLATQLGRPHGNCNPFWVSFNTSTHAGGLTIDGIGTLSDATVANGPAIHGAFREVGPHFDMVDPDMPHVEIMASEDVLPMQNVLQRQSLMKGLKPHVAIKRVEMARKPHYRAFASDASAISNLVSAVDDVKGDEPHPLHFMSSENWLEDWHWADTLRKAQRVSALNARQRDFSSPPDWFEVDLTRRRELIKKGKEKLAKYTQSKHHMAVDEQGGRRKSRRMRHRRRTLKRK